MNKFAKIIIIAVLSFQAQVFAGTRPKDCPPLWQPHLNVQNGPPLQIEEVGGKEYIRGVSNTVPATWKALPSSPEELAKFSDKKFKLLVHAAMSDHKIDRFIVNPNYLAEAFTFSASVIDQDHRGTFGNYGFIIAAPSENILATSTMDMGSPLTNQHLPDAYYARLINSNPVQKPSEVLKCTEGYNEVMIAGTTSNGGATRIIGLFIKTWKGKVQVAPEVEARVREFAEDHQLPVLVIGQTK